jgi:5'-3' exoribonuclease 1
MPPLSIPHGPAEIELWRKKATRIDNTYSKRLGMVIGQIESLVHVEPLKGLRKTDEGATVKEYAQIPGMETDFASQTVVEAVFSEDQRFLERAALPIEEEFPEGSRAFFLGEFNYGRPLEITRHVANKVEIWIQVAKEKEPNFGHTIVKRAERELPYTPSFSVAKTLGINPLVLSKITASFQVISGDNKLNLGLNLKFEAKKLKVLGYSRRGQNGWEFSQKAIELLQQYMIKFPEFVAGIQRNPRENIYNATDFYHESDAPLKIKEIQAWLKSIESKNFEKVPLEAEQLDSNTVMKIEEAADAALKAGPPVEVQKIKGVPRNALLKPSDAEHRLGSQTFTLGDRIVYVQDSGRVPIATRGTVVGLTRTTRMTLLDVVFDDTFMSGTSLGDRCSPFRGSTIPTTSVLNLSKPQVQAISKAAESRRVQQQATPLIAKGYGAPTGPNGRGQLQPASAPPLLRDSFRGVLSRYPNGMAGGVARGRGGPGFIQQPLPPQLTNGNGRGGRGGGPGNGRGRVLTNVNGRAGWRGGRGGPVGNGVQPQNYHAVPPPPSLDARGGARGSSRGRARGARGRGGPVVNQPVQQVPVQPVPVQPQTQ